MAVDADRSRLDPNEVIELSERYDCARWTTEALVDSLSAEDCAVASHAEACPAKWHLAHTTWFIEQFLLIERMPRYQVFDDRYGGLFKSGPSGRNAGSEGCARTLTRPSLDEVFDYRAFVDRSLIMLMHAERSRQFSQLVEIAIQHEQRHQERILTDVKHLFATNPMQPALLEETGESAVRSSKANRADFVAFEPGVRAFGHHGEGFSFDDERPRHRHFMNSFALADRLVTNGEWREFMSAGGYRRRDHWFDEGWAVSREREWTAPLYWFRKQGVWWHYTLTGPRPVADAEPVCHVSYYEADAFARWTGKRLPTEFEWELAAEQIPVQGNFLEQGRLRPNVAPHPVESGGSEEDSTRRTPIRQLFGDVWEWTSSPYVAYPGYQRQSPRRDNSEGRFGASAMVLRGGACVTPAEHVRASYRRALDPAARWQFTGLRLADHR